MDRLVFLEGEELVALGDQLLVTQPAPLQVRDFQTGGDVLRILTGGHVGPPGPAGPVGPPGSYDDMEDLTLLFENGLI